MIRGPIPTERDASRDDYVRNAVPMRLSRFGHPQIVLAFVVFFAATSVLVWVVERSSGSGLANSLLPAPIVFNSTPRAHLPPGAFNSARFNVWVPDEAFDVVERASDFMSPLESDSMSWDALRPYAESKGGEWWVATRNGSMQYHGVPLACVATDHSAWHVHRVSPERHKDADRLADQVTEFVIMFHSAPDRQKFVWYQQRGALRNGTGFHWKFGPLEFVVDLVWWLLLAALLISGATFFPWLDRTMRRRKLISLLAADRCPRCKYDLSGAPIAARLVTCPECGTTIPNFSGYAERLDEPTVCVKHRDQDDQSSSKK